VRTTHTRTFGFSVKSAVTLSTRYPVSIILSAHTHRPSLLYYYYKYYANRHLEFTRSRVQFPFPHTSSHYIILLSLFFVFLLEIKLLCSNYRVWGVGVPIIKIFITRYITIFECVHIYNIKYKIYLKRMNR